MRKTTKTNDGITAIYVRRSVSDKDKGNNSLSISAQKEECIRFVGECDYRIYCDEGISATNTRHREGFNRMIADALKGKIDLIVTKSVSRFARNTVDSLTTIRKLKEKGVEVFFQKENIYTLDSKGELLLTIVNSSNSNR